jgi:hypothetical protein
MYDKDEDRKKRRRVDMLVRELKEELEARDQPKTGNMQQGAAPEAARRNRARASCREREP